MQRRFHYEQAFEHYLRANRVPYVAVDEAKKALLPEGADEMGLGSLKSFDFVVYAPDRNLLLDVKGRKFAGSGRRLESWVGLDDIHGLAHWGRLFGKGFVPTFVFIYWCAEQPPDALFQEVFEFNHRWYAMREITLADYRQVMRPRSERWQTVSVPTREFELVSGPFSVRGQRPPGASERVPVAGRGVERARFEACSGSTAPIS